MCFLKLHATNPLKKCMKRSKNERKFNALLFNRFLFLILPTKFVDLCILLGCDYCDSIKGKASQRLSCTHCSRLLHTAFSVVSNSYLFLNIFGLPFTNIILLLQLPPSEQYTILFNHLFFSPCDSKFQGIGPHRAYALIKQYHSIEEILKHLDTKKYPGRCK